MKPGARLALLLSTLALMAGLLAPAGAAARSCRQGNDHPVYSLSVFGGAGCGTGAVVANRLARRFDAPRRFRAGFPRRFIHQRDALGRRWKCQWNSASVQDDIVSWNCARRSVELINWTWRATRP